MCTIARPASPLQRKSRLWRHALTRRALSETLPRHFRVASTRGLSLAPLIRRATTRDRERPRARVAPFTKGLAVGGAPCSHLEVRAGIISFAKELAGKAADAASPIERIKSADVSGLVAETRRD